MQLSNSSRVVAAVTLAMIAIGLGRPAAAGPDRDIMGLDLADDATLDSLELKGGELVTHGSPSEEAEPFDLALTFKPDGAPTSPPRSALADAPDSPVPGAASGAAGWMDGLGPLPPISSAAPVGVLVVVGVICLRRPPRRG